MIKHEFCREHRSHFCPCLRPALYEHGFHDVKEFKGIDSLEKSERAWDEAERRHREKQSLKTENR